MLKAFDNISIAAKIIFGFALVFGIFGFVTLISFQNYKEERANLESVTNLTDNSAKILDINREISEIQRLVNVYSVTGGHTIINKIKNSYASLNKKLNDVSKTTDSKKRKDLIHSLTLLLESYGQNINSLENRYHYRHELINEKLPTVFLKGVRLLEKGVQTSLKNKKLNSVILYKRLLQKWYELNYNAAHFLDKKDYQYKERLRQVVLELKETSRRLKRTKSPYSGLVDEYVGIFEQSVQANRVYLSLVNVVMAGASIEFNTISKQLREDSISELNLLLAKSDQIFNDNKRILYLSVLITLPLLFLIGFYYQLSIASGIKQIAETFKGFIQGNLDQDIPGLERKDEIGELAKAADNFREVSIKIKNEQARAERLTESKSKFLATMSHEIRTPMNAVLSCTNLLMDEIKDHQHLDLLKTIKVSGDSLLVLINDILDYSKIESDKINLEYNIFSLKECLQSVIDLLSSQASKKGVLLSLDLQSQYPEYIKGDVTRLRQVLVNLVGNGIKFTKDKVRIHVKSHEYEAGKVQLQFFVKDNGIGIQEDAQVHLFQEFSQVDASTTRRFGGTGLGLAICKGIVEAMGGRIGVHSQVNQGSEFFFIFKTTIEQGQPQEEKNVMAHTMYHQSFDLKILMAEDNSINQMVAQKLIEKIGHRMDMVSNGHEAVEAVQYKDYDIVFMDQHMPEMDGIEATMKIRTLSIKQPMIFAITASAFQEDRERCLNAGMDGFLTKPIVPEHVISALNQCCGDGFSHLQSDQHLQDSALLDHDGLLTLFDNDHDLLIEVSEVFLRQLPEIIHEIQENVEKKDFDALKQMFHGLKGSLAHFGNLELIELVSRLEEMAREKNLNLSEELMPKLIADLEKLKNELNIILQKKVA